uniref:Uncharacterized protein n=1 Tax=Nelumbo nucifera TaxID=4432 RepID=A0A822XH17_NELNU|nr:TPA_asm: hypothetical protein HUJ06_019588 [Nelumbo nucifera]
MLRNNGFDSDAVPFSEGLVGLATCMPDNDDYDADLLTRIACDTTGAEQSPERTSIVASSCEIVNVSPSIAFTYKCKFPWARRERKQSNMVVSPYLAPGQQGARREAHRIRVVDVTYPEYYHALRHSWNLQRDVNTLMQKNLALRQRNLELGREIRDKGVGRNQCIEQ